MDPLPTPYRELASRRLIEAFDALDEGIAVLDVEGVVQFLNATTLRVLNVAPDDVVGCRLQEISWDILDGDGHRLARADHPALVALETGEAQPVRALGVRAPSLGDETVWVESGARPILEDGVMTGVVAFFRDVTARRRAADAERALERSETKFDALVSMLPVGVFQTDPNGLATYVNDAACEIVGLSYEEILGEGWAGALHPDDQERVSEEWRTAAQEGRAYESEHRYVHGGGEIRWVMVSAVPFGEEGAERLGFLGSLTDITRQKLAQQREEELIGVVSHELRTPLVAIGGALSYLEGLAEELDDRGRHLYRMAVRNAAFLDRLVQELLDFERLKGGAAQLEIEAVGVDAILNDAVELAFQPAEVAEVRLEKVAAPAGVRVEADRDRILQLLLNLLSNAIRFSDAGTTVRLTASVDGSAVTVRVTDQGRGIPAEQQERVFERFVQLGDEGQAQDGAGLGLSIAREIARRHGSRLEVESEVGVGSTFSFSLPLATTAP
jgi:PAS domain S-box-containing protein